MRYLGGKYKIRKQVAGYLESVRDGRDYLEPFVGSASVLQEMSGTRTASDSNGALITMYRALQEGWTPPDDITEEMYAHYRKGQDENDPLTAFIGIGCSFGGKWFGGYARGGIKRNYAGEAKSSLIKLIPFIKGVHFNACLYSDYTPENMLIYCDPPYEGTTGYGDIFDSLSFWNVMRKWSENNTVVISEFKAPADFKCVLSIGSRTSIRNSENISASTVEKLFIYNY
jgi:DNA adenine methylase